MNLCRLSFLIVVLGFALSAGQAAPADNALGLHSDGGGWGFHPAGQPNSKLPFVLLVGDSVMNGYSSEVSAALAGKANVDAWATGMHLANPNLLHDLVKVLARRSYAVVHFNIGLHDWPEGRIPKEQYEPLMNLYFDAYLSNAPKSKLIWASSTPVTAKGLKSPDPAINPIIVRQNQIAAGVAQSHTVQLNDLYSLGLQNLDLARGDQFHWSPAGSRLLGARVAERIAALLEAPGNSTVGGYFLTSPDEQVELLFELDPVGEPMYSVSYHGEKVLLPGRLGLISTNRTSLTRGLRVAGTERGGRDERWRPVAGERSEVRDHFNSLTVRLADSQTGAEAFHLEFRSYNEGVAFRYRCSQALEGFLTASEELSEFVFSGNHFCWPVYSAQGVYQRRRLSEVKPGCERPLTVELPSGRWAALGEARLVDFARLKLRPGGRAHGLRAQLDAPAALRAGEATPWRFVLLADSPAQLLERNDLVLNLNDPCAIADTSWIKPGTVLREVSLTTDGAHACIDFAARMGIDYVLFDAGWYGHEYSNASDARGVNLDPQRSKGPLDLQQVIRYGEKNNVGIFLYVNRRALEKQLDQILPLYRQWGVKGVKYGFVNVGSQHWTTWLHEAVRKAADHQLMVDIHDEYRPTGVSRTWPNLLTQEGIRGNEEMPTAEHNLILPFTRFLCGPADYTFCWNDPRLKATRSHQLAASVVFFSPLQFLFWYDRPGQIAENPALDFWHNLPTVWDETRVLEGKPGAYATVARRHGSAWYLGSMNGHEPRQLLLKLDFLEPGKTYETLICSDGEESPGVQAGVRTMRRIVRRGDPLSAQVSPNGGLAMRLTPSP